MPKRAIVALLTTALALVLLLSFKTPDRTSALGTGGGVAVVSSSSASSAPVDSGATGSTSGAASPESGSSGSAAAGSGSAGSGSAGQAATPSPTATTVAKGNGTYTGPVISTRYGDTQVQVTLKNGKIVSVTALQLPNEGRSGAISQYVEPVLQSEALAAQSAQIDLVSGATYTSDAYAQSLQGALDQANS